MSFKIFKSISGSGCQCRGCGSDLWVIFTNPNDKKNDNIVFTVAMVRRAFNSHGNDKRDILNKGISFDEIQKAVFAINKKLQP